MNTSDCLIQTPIVTNNAMKCNEYSDILGDCLLLWHHIAEYWLPNTNECCWSGLFSWSHALIPSKFLRNETSKNGHSSKSLDRKKGSSNSQFWAKDVRVIVCSDPPFLYRALRTKITKSMNQSSPTNVIITVYTNLIWSWQFLLF